jgi:hypothetical protein
MKPRLASGVVSTAQAGTGLCHQEGMLGCKARADVALLRGDEKAPRRGFALVWNRRG